MFKRGLNHIVISCFMAFLIFALSICGTTAMATQNDFEISGLTPLEKSQSIEGEVANYNGDSFENNLVFHELNTHASYEVTLRNTSNEDYILDEVSIDDSGDYLAFTFENYAGKKVAAGAEVSFTMRVEYVAQLDDLSDRAQAVRTVINVRYSSDSASNPQTADNVIIFVAILIVAVIGLVIVIIKMRKKGALIVSALFAVAILGGLFVGAAQADGGIYAIDFRAEYVLYDRVKVSIVVDGETTNEIIDYGATLEEPNVNVPAGYTFNGWKDASGANFSFANPITEDINVSADISANPDTAYKVVHNKMTVDGSDYVFAEEETGTGTTDTEVTPATKDYPGFERPDAQTDTILGDGSRVFTYNYDRKKFALTITNAEYVTGATSKEYYYETPLTLTAATREGYLFKGWTNGETTTSINIVMNEAMEIGPIYELEVQPETFTLDGQCVFTSDGITGTDDCSDYLGQEYIDTGISLFSEENAKKDFKISFNIDEFRYGSTIHRATLINSTLEVKDRQYPGIVLRRHDNKNGYYTLGSNVVKDHVKLTSTKLDIPIAGTDRFTLIRKNNLLCYVINDGNPVFVDDYTEFNEYFNDTVWFGASIENNVVYRQMYGKLSDLDIWVGKDIDNELSCEKE